MTTWHWARIFSGVGVLLTIALLYLFWRHRRDVIEAKRLLEEVQSDTARELREQRDLLTEIRDRTVTELTQASLETEHLATRKHMANIGDNVRHDTEVTKTRMNQVVEAVRKLARVFGVNVDL